MYVQLCKTVTKINQKMNSSILLHCTLIQEYVSVISKLCERINKDDGVNILCNQIYDFEVKPGIRLVEK